MSVFKIAEEIDNSPDNSPDNSSQLVEKGEHAIPDIPHSPEFLDHFHKVHNQLAKGRWKEGYRPDLFSFEDDQPDLTSMTDKGSYILHGDGTIDLLRTHHGFHMRDVKEKMMSENPQASDNYRQEWNKIDDTYNRIHHYFGGGIRLYMYEDYRDNFALDISCKQLPTPSQMKSLETFIGRQAPDRIDFEADVNINGQVETINLNNKPWDDIKAFINSYRKNNLAPSPEVQQRIQTIKDFRDPMYGKPQIPKIPQRPFPPTPAQRIMPDMNVKIPPTLRYQGASPSYQEIIKIAQKLDDIGQYKESEDVFNLFFNI